MRGAPDIVSLRSGGLSLDLCPALGGSITALSWNHPKNGSIDLLRPTPPASIAKADIEAVACFPLTPFSNRVRHGRFTFEGREIVMPANTNEPHVQHGHGWQRPWDVAMATDDMAILRLTHAADEWPFDYVMEQRFQLAGGGLAIDLVARNEDERAMPYGFGLHPYFLHTPRCRLTAAVSGFWESDAEVMPVQHTPPPAALDPAKGLPVAEQTMDNAFTGWDGHAVIEWPENATRLAMSASAPFGVLVVYIPPGESYFCAEPVSNTTDAFNLAHQRNDTGMLVLRPDTRITARVTFAPQDVG